LSFSRRESSLTRERRGREKVVSTSIYRYTKWWTRNENGKEGRVPGKLHGRRADLVCLRLGSSLPLGHVDEYRAVLLRKKEEERKVRRLGG